MYRRYKFKANIGPPVDPREKSAETKSLVIAALACWGLYYIVGPGLCLFLALPVYYIAKARYVRRL